MDNLVPDEIAAASPSYKDGISSNDEYLYRLFACDLIQEAGGLLKLPQAVMITAQSIVQRFFYRESLRKFDAHQVAMGALFLAAKVEENARRAQDVVNVFVRLKQARTAASSEATPLDPASDEFAAWKAALLLTEAVILKELGYDMYEMTCHPHRFVLFFVELLRGPPELAQRCWNYVNDCFRLDICVRHPPETIACVAVLCAAEDLSVGLPQHPPWYSLLCPHTPCDTLVGLAAQLRQVYTTSRPQWLPSLRHNVPGAPE